MKQQEWFWEKTAAEVSFTEEEVILAGGGEPIPLFVSDIQGENMSNLINEEDTVQASKHRINFALQLNSSLH